MQYRRRVASPWPAVVGPPVPAGLPRGSLPPSPRPSTSASGPSPAAAAGVDAPPHRPLRPSWEPPAVPGPKSCAAVEPYAVAARSAGSEFDASELVDDVEAAERNTKSARQQAQAVGAERLFDVFHERFPDGIAPIDQLLPLFEVVGQPATAEGIRATTTQVCPEVKEHLTFPQAQEVFLVIQDAWRTAVWETEQLQQAGHWARWVAGLSDTGSTNVLLALVVALCALSTLLVGGVAILLLMLDRLHTVAAYLQEDLGVVQDSVEVFAHQIAYQKEADEAQTLVTTLSSVLQTVVYASNVEAKRSRLQKAATAVASVLAAWLDFVPQPSFGGLAVVAAGLVNTSLARYGINQTARLFDEVNAQMPDHTELVLGQWQDGAPDAIEFLTHFRYKDQCAGGVCVADSAAVTALMRAALTGTASTQLTVDYRQRPVFASAIAVGAAGIGVEFTEDADAVYRSRLAPILAIVEGWSASSNYTYEFTVAAELTPGARTLLTPLRGCDAVCPQALAAGTPLGRALDGEAGTVTFTNVRGVPALVAFSKVGSWPGGVAVQTDLSHVVAETVDEIIGLVTLLNSQYPLATQEFELTAFEEEEGNFIFHHLSGYKYADQCPFGRCVTPTEYVRLAAQNCSSGVVRATDYRGMPVLAGYHCLADLRVVLSLKWDVGDVEGEILEAAIDAIDERNQKDIGDPSQFLVAAPNQGLAAADVRGYDDFTVLSRVKFPDLCAKPNCTWHSLSALRALQGLEDVIDCADYRHAAVKAAPSRSDAVSVGLGLAAEVDRTAALQSAVDLAIRIGGFAIGMTALGTLVLAAVTKRSLGAMIRAKEVDHAVVEQEKDRFRGVVASMYPVYVVPRLLKGEKQMVCEVPGAAVFFSDIHNFTSASNTMGSAELLKLLGYVYGAMDVIAHQFKVYKVKTIGDAYLAVAGLPGEEAENPCLDLLRFASCVCQVFGDRFVHPPEGQVLAAMNRAMAWTSGVQNSTRAETPLLFSTAPALPWRRRRLPRAARRGSADSAVPAAAPAVQRRLQQSEACSVPEGQEASVQCIMSYGLAAGKIVAGVLAGRCPMFDIWGATVNLASRMQSTGEPGHIQVSEQLYQRVMATGGQPFTFDAPRSTHCKGFGEVQAYMVRGTAEGLPKDLQAQLRLEPRYGAFRFDNPLPPARPPEAESLAPASPPPVSGPVLP